HFGLPVSRVSRKLLPDLHAMSFELRGMLGQGVTGLGHHDGHGKTLSYHLLAMPVAHRSPAHAPAARGVSQLSDRNNYGAPRPLRTHSGLGAPSLCRRLRCLMLGRAQWSRRSTVVSTTGPERGSLSRHRQCVEGLLVACPIQLGRV